MPDAREMNLLQHAFESFDQAAVSLQETYRALTARVERLDLELAASNEALRVNLADNENMRRHLTAILESLTTGVIVADYGGLIIRCNQAAEMLVGITRDRMLHRSLDEVLAQAGLHGSEYPVTAPSGAILSLSRSALHDGHGCASGHILLLHDMTAVRRLEERLQWRDRLASMGEMVGRIAHEIRNPLGSVELFASMLRKDLSHDPPRRQYADHISGAVQGMNRLLTNLLLYTRPNAPQPAWHRADILLRDTLALAAQAITAAGVSTHIRLDDSNCEVWCDEGQMKQILLNLLLNAVQAMPDGGELTVAITDESRFDSAPRWVRITVTDTGQGIPPESRSRLFDPFFTTRPDGSGLGLAIVHALVEGHRGRLDVESTVGKGSRFTVVLPADVPMPAQAVVALSGKHVIAAEGEEP